MRKTRIYLLFLRIKPYIYIIAREGFQIILLTYFLLILCEMIKPGFVSYFLNAVVLLPGVIVLGLFLIVAEIGNNQLTDQQLSNKVWHKLFYKLTTNAALSTQNTLMLKMAIAKKMTRQSRGMNYREWFLYDREQKVKYWLSRQIPHVSWLKYLTFTKDRDWELFIRFGMSKKMSQRDREFVFILGLSSICFVFIQTQYLGVVSYLLSGLVGVIVLCISYIILTDSQ
jgi:hypothetical protein